MVAGVGSGVITIAPASADEAVPVAIGVVGVSLGIESTAMPEPLSTLTTLPTTVLPVGNCTFTLACPPTAAAVVATKWSSVSATAIATPPYPPAVVGVGGADDVVAEAAVGVVDAETVEPGWVPAVVCAPPPAGLVLVTVEPVPDVLVGVVFVADDDGGDWPAVSDSAVESSGSDDDVVSSTGLVATPPPEPAVVGANV
jgi:hypothetical protein